MVSPVNVAASLAWSVTKMKKNRFWQLRGHGLFRTRQAAWTPAVATIEGADG